MSGAQAIFATSSPYANRVYGGEKSFEFGRRPVRIRVPFVMWVCATRPVSLCTGQVLVSEAIFGGPEDISQMEGEKERPHLRQYSAGGPSCTALSLSSPARLPLPIGLADFGVERAPQSYLVLGRQ